MVSNVTIIIIIIIISSSNSSSSSSIVFIIYIIISIVLIIIMTIVIIKFIIVTSMARTINVINHHYDLHQVTMSILEDHDQDQERRTQSFHLPRSHKDHQEHRDHQDDCDHRGIQMARPKVHTSI